MGSSLLSRFSKGIAATGLGNISSLMLGLTTTMILARRLPAEEYGQSRAVAERELFMPFHFAEAPVNVLTRDELDPYSKIPPFKLSACRVETEPIAPVR